MNKRLITIAGIALACLLVLGLHTSASAQGRGRGGGNGGGGGVGRGVGGGSSMGTGGSSSIGVDRGINTSSDRSNGRADRGRGNASTRSNARSDAGLDRARIAGENSRRADEDLNKHPGMTQGLNMSANQLHDAYNTALLTNPNLKFGQFVAATRLARNLGDRYPNVTRDAILAGLANGRSIGQTLQDLGLSSDDAKRAEKQVKREIDQSRRNRS